LTRKSKMANAVNWCYTLNNYTLEEVEYLKTIECKYHVFQSEVGERGTPHIQGFIQLKKKKRFNQVKELISQRAHIENMKGTALEASDYCEKEPRGEIIFKTGKISMRAARNDLEEFKKKVKEGKRGLELVENYSAVYAKYPRFCHDYIRMINESKVEIENLVPYNGWQQTLFENLQQEPDSRKIIWYTDIVGNSGKSYFSTHYNSKSKYLVTGGKNADIFYAFNYEEVIFFDLARMKQEYVPYDVMEAFKNGYFLSTKYEVRPVKFKVPHVVVFSNFLPNFAMLSEDRWDHREITNQTDNFPNDDWVLRNVRRT